MVQQSSQHAITSYFNYHEDKLRWNTTTIINVLAFNDPFNIASSLGVNTLDNLKLKPLARQQKLNDCKYKIPSNAKSYLIFDLEIETTQSLGSRCCTNYQS